MAGEGGGVLIFKQALEIEEVRLGHQENPTSVSIPANKGRMFAGIWAAVGGRENVAHSVF